MTSCNGCTVANALTPGALCVPCVEASVRPPCPECGGAGIEFRGSGNDLQHKTCSRWKEPGHPTEAEIRAELSRMFNLHYPTSGRFA